MQLRRWSESLFISFHILPVAPFPRGWVPPRWRVRLPIKRWSVFQECSSTKESNFPVCVPPLCVYLISTGDIKARGHLAGIPVP